MRILQLLDELLLLPIHLCILPLVFIVDLITMFNNKFTWMTIQSILGSLDVIIWGTTGIFTSMHCWGHNKLD